MKKYLFLFLLSISFLTFTSCEEQIETSDLKYISFGKTDVSFDVSEGTEASQEFYFYTTNKSSSDKTFNIEVLEASTADAGFYSIPSTVTVPGGSNKGMISISITDGTWLDTDQTIMLRLTSDEYAVGQVATYNVSRLCGAGTVKLAMDITFDDGYPEEIAWRILDATGATVIASATPFGYGAYADLEDGISVAAGCLPEGDYTLEVYDSYGDGGHGYSVKANGATIATIAQDSFTSSAAIAFTL
ncbi:hypothetical protein RRF68_05960 [Tenacibaculum sp. HL-MS23]|uniref:hypothetical protein n=1 Tax=Tenacibaculum TaxID=104267 RepID=UPI001C500D3B|nr:MULTISPECIES: hypothetical protein [Tenacibaculum]QXP72491.1 hypothetical protein H0I30_07215 [Tenacibaculum sp. AHE14PA]QXP76407.1 hypothetical protein H0I31_01960 [Tenacibaculum sp. AHE15PA]WNW02941.1 hypothetical protein RRF68_05960 [Tenacibaculum sp. HL-MS23]